MEKIMLTVGKWEQSDPDGRILRKTINLWCKKCSYEGTVEVAEGSLLADQFPPVECPNCNAIKPKEDK